MTLQRLRHRDAVRNPRSDTDQCETPSGKAVTVPGLRASRNDTPFRPLAEALNPCRAESRCALMSLKHGPLDNALAGNSNCQWLPAASGSNISADDTLTDEFFSGVLTLASGGR